MFILLQVSIFKCFSSVNPFVSPFQVILNCLVFLLFTWWEPCGTINYDDSICKITLPIFCFLDYPASREKHSTHQITSIWSKCQRCPDVVFTDMYYIPYILVHKFHFQPLPPGQIFQQDPVKRKFDKTKSWWTIVVLYTFVLFKTNNLAKFPLIFQIQM